MSRQGPTQPSAFPGRVTFDTALENPPSPYTHSIFMTSYVPILMP